MPMVLELRNPGVAVKNKVSRKTSCVTSDKLLHLSVLQFPHL